MTIPPATCAGNVTPEAMKMSMSTATNLGQIERKGIALRVSENRKPAAISFHKQGLLSTPSTATGVSEI